jgi:hypothetical protein
MYIWWCLFCTCCMGVVGHKGPNKCFVHFPRCFWILICHASYCIIYQVASILQLERSRREHSNYTLPSIGDVTASTYATFLISDLMWICSSASCTVFSRILVGQTKQKRVQQLLLRKRFVKPMRCLTNEFWNPNHGFTTRMQSNIGW